MGFHIKWSNSCTIFQQILQKIKYKNKIHWGRLPPTTTTSSQLPRTLFAPTPLFKQQSFRVLSILSQQPFVGSWWSLKSPNWSSTSISNYSMHSNVILHKISLLWHKNKLLVIRTCLYFYGPPKQFFVQHGHMPTISSVPHVLLMKNKNPVARKLFNSVIEYSF